RESARLGRCACAPWAGQARLVKPAPLARCACASRSRLESSASGPEGEGVALSGHCFLRIDPLTIVARVLSVGAGLAKLPFSYIPRKATSQDVQQADERVPVEGDLRGEYQRRLEAARRDSDRWSRLDGLVANLRLFVFCAAGVLAFLVYRVHWPGPLWLLPSVLAFAALVLVHESMRRRGQRAKRTIGFYENALARLDDRWAGTGDEGLDFQDLNHPYAADLDLFGKGSLF